MYYSNIIYQFVWIYVIVIGDNSFLFGDFESPPKYFTQEINILILYESAKIRIENETKRSAQNVNEICAL